MAVTVAAAYAYFFTGLQSDVIDQAELLRLVAEHQKARSSPSSPETQAGIAAADFEATLFVDSDPAGAQVVMDGDTVGVTPVHQPGVKAGVYVLSIYKDRHSRVDTVIFVDENDAAPSAFFALQTSAPEPRNGASSTLPASVEPDRSLREQIRGFAPENDIAEDRGRRNGSMSARSSAEVRPGDAAEKTSPKAGETREGARTSMDSASPPATGTLTVLVRPWGSIYVDGELKKQDTDVRNTVSLPVGSHVVRAEHPTLGAKEQRIEIRAERPMHVLIDLMEAESIRSVNSIPSEQPAGEDRSGRPDTYN